MSKTKVGVIIVNYLNAKMTIEYIKHFSSMVYGARFIFYIVNHTTNNKQRKLLETFSNAQQEKNVKLYHYEKTLGFASANNLAAYNAYKDGVDYLLFSNNDIIIPKKMNINQLINLLNLPKVVICSPCIVDKHGNEYLPSHRETYFERLIYYFFPYFSLFKKRKRVYKKTKQSLDEWYYAPGCFFLIKTKDYILAKGMDERTELYFEESILAEKFRSTGKKIYVTRCCKIIHLGSQTIGKLNLKIWNIYLKSEKIYWKYYREIPGVGLVLLRFFGWFHYILYKKICPGIKKLISNKVGVKYVL